MLQRALLASLVLLLVMFGSYSPVSAIPACLGGTLGDYIALGGGGCQSAGLTFSSFVYNNGGTPPDADAVTVSVGGHSIHVGTSEPDFVGTFLLDFLVAGPSIGGNDLFFAGSLGPEPFPQAQVTASLTPGGVLSVFALDHCATPDSCKEFDRVRFASVSSQVVNMNFGGIDGGVVAGFTLDVVATSEPATLLLLSTTAVGLGLTGWRQRPRT